MHRHALSALALSLGLAVAPFAHAQQRPVPPPVPSAAPLTVASVHTFLQELDRALVGSHRAWLAAHVQFPLPAQYLDYNMASRQRSRSVADASALLRMREDLGMPHGFALTLASGSARTGEPLCDEQDTGPSARPETWARGPAAVTLTPAGATVRFVRVHCGSTQNLGIYEVRPTALGGPQLAAIRVDRGR